MDDPAVSRVSVTPSSPEALLFGVVLGAVAAMLAVVAMGFEVGAIPTAFKPAVLFLVAWVGASWFLSHDTGRVLVVLRRGFGLGLLEWAILALWGAGASAADSTAIGFAASLSGSVATVMVWVCAAGFVLFWLWTRSPYGELGTDRM